MAKSMSDRSRMCHQMTLLAIGSAISSLGSQAGPMRSDSPGGQMTGRSGPAHVPANHFPVPAKKDAMKMTDTSGRPGSISSASADLQLSLANRLQVGMDSRGSMLFRLIWSQRVTPSGRSIFRLAALARPTKGSAYSSWPAPTLEDQRDSRRHGYMFKANAGTTLPDAARMAGWHTPQRADGRGRTGPKSNNSDLGRQVSGMTLNGSNAATGNSGRLNHRFSLWLMGYPEEWASCGEAAAASLHPSQRSSSRR